MPSCFICHKGIVQSGNALFIDAVGPLSGYSVCLACASREALQKKVERYRKVVRGFATLASKTSFDFDGLDSDAVVEIFVEQHRSNQQEMIFFLKKVISKLGDKAGNSCYEDDRNKWALNWCQRVSKISDV